MRELWCWRCEMKVPMLDEEEFSKIERLYLQPLEHPTATPWGFLSRWQPMLNLYYKLTHFQETNHNAIMHHRLSLYGPPWDRCGKPLRTPQAKLCAACGWRRAA